MNILVLNGPNLNMLGVREPELYGNKTYKDLEDFIKEYCREVSVTVDIKQSNLEGILIDILHWSNDHFDGVIFNAGAFTHYSYALYDAIKSIQIPVIEVHLTDITTREDFRKVSVIKEACKASIMGYGFNSYTKAIDLLLKEVS